MLDIVVQRGHYSRHIFPVDGLVMGVIVRPNRRCSLHVAQFPFNRDASYNCIAGNFLEVEEAAKKKKVSASVAAQ